LVKPPICRWQAERRRLSMTRGVILRRLCKPLLDSTTGNSQKARVNISKEEAGLLAESDLIAACNLNRKFWHAYTEHRTARK
jgi:hypothetical protein